MEQTTMNPEELWFNTPDTHTLCRGGGNGPAHPSQLYAIKKYVERGMYFLDYGIEVLRWGNKYFYADYFCHPEFISGSAI